MIHLGILFKTLEHGLRLGLPASTAASPPAHRLLVERAQRSDACLRLNASELAVMAGRAAHLRRTARVRAFMQFVGDALAERLRQA